LYARGTAQQKERDPHFSSSLGRTEVGESIVQELVAQWWLEEGEIADQQVEEHCSGCFETMSNPG
jgi:hypothetical protein